MPTWGIVYRSPCKGYLTWTPKGCVLLLFLCRDQQSALSYQSEKILYPEIRRPISKEPNNAESCYSANVSSKVNASVRPRDCAPFRIAPRYATKHVMLVAAGITDIVPHKLFNVILSNFFPFLVHLLKNNVIGYAFEATKCIVIVDALKLRLLQLQERGGTAKVFDGDGFEQSDASLEQWRQDVHIGSHEESIRKNIISLLSEFASMWDERLRKITTVKHHFNLELGSILAFQILYRAGLKTIEREGEETDWTLNEVVIEPAMSE